MTNNQNLIITFHYDLVTKLPLEIHFGKRESFFFVRENTHTCTSCLHLPSSRIQNTVDVFQDKFEQLLDKQNIHKTFLISGDFNIDFLRFF